MRQRIKAWLGVGGGFIVAILLVFLFTTWPRDVLQKPLTVNEELHETDVIIVLGAGTRQHDPNNLPPQAEQRIYAGVDLYKVGVANHLIMAGGKSPVTKLVEADLMASQAALDGALPTDIVLERASRDTWQNAENSRSIMRVMGWKTATVVTSPYHTWRACRMFRKQGADVTCVAADYALAPAHNIYNRFMDNRAVVREYGAIVLAWVQGRL